MVPLLLASAAALAADVVQGANTAAMGGVGVAAPSDNAAITLNPGLIGLVERFDFHAHFRLGPTGDLQWAATAIDSRTSERFGAGFAYSGDRYDPPLTNNELPGWSLPGEELANRRRQDDFTLGLGVPLLGRRLSLGASVLFSRFNHDRDGKGSTADVHVGIGVRPVEWLTVGAGIRNLAPIPSPQDRPLSWVAGARLEATRAAIEGNVWSSTDPLAPSSWSIAAGGEVSPTVGTRVRLGMFRDGPLQRTRLTAGFGLVSERGGGLDYALMVPVAGQELRPGTLVHQIAVRFSAPDEDLLDPER